MFSSPKKQHGIATVLIVLLVGVALSASTLGVIYSLKATQNKQVTSHAKTNAESAAWTLVDVARQYIQANASNGAAFANYLSTLPETIDLNAGGVPLLGNFSASTINIFRPTDISGAATAVTISINAVDRISKSTASVSAVIDVTPGTTQNSCIDPSSADIKGSLDTNELDLYMSGDQAGFTVDGNVGVSGSNLSVHGLKYLRATGDITLKGTDDAGLDFLQANGDITITSTAKIEQILSGRNISYASNAFASELRAAGNIDWLGSEGSALIQAGVLYEGKGVLDGTNGTENIAGTITFSKDDPKTHSVIKTRASMNMNFSNVTIDEIYTQGDLTISTYNNGLNIAVAKESITCQNSNITLNVTAGVDVMGPVITDGAGTSTDLNCNASIIREGDAILAAEETTMDSYEPVEVSNSYLADADNYPANYSFSRDNSGKTIVDVKNVNGLTPGKYYLLTDPMNHLAHEATPDQDSGFNICGDNIGTECIKFHPNIRILTDTNDRPTYIGQELSVNALRTETDDANPNTIEAHPLDGIWEITYDAASLAPGVFYFDRDLRIRGQNGKFYTNTFLAAGDIQTLNPITVIAVNGTPEEVLCRNSTITSIDYENFKVAAKNEDGEPILNEQGEATFVETDSLVPKFNTAAGPRFPTLNGVYPYPTNFCGSNSQGIITKKYGNEPREEGGTLAGPAPLVGQFAALAGQENDGVNGGYDEYVGGNIYSQTSMTFIGRVLAGNAIQFVDGANINIYGNIGSEARADGKASAQNILGKTIKIHQKFLDILTEGSSSDCVESSGGNASSTVLWSGYF